MNRRLKICRIVSYVGIAMVLVVYIAMAYISANIENIGVLPYLLVRGMQMLLGIGSALTISGVVLGLYYKGKSRGKGLGSKK